MASSGSLRIVRLFDMVRAGGAPKGRTATVTRQIPNFHKRGSARHGKRWQGR